MRSRPRIRGFGYEGRYRYFVTICTGGRRRVFVDRATVHDVHSVILASAQAEHFSLLAYCYMPDHVHLLVEALTPAASLKRFVRQAKQKAGYVYRRTHRHRLWQPSFYDRVLRRDESTPRVARYILENPIRAGLVGDLLEYEFIGSSVCAVEDFFRT